MSLAKRQKLLSFCTGLAVAGAAYVSTQRLVWKCTADLADHSRGAPDLANQKKPRAFVDEQWKAKNVQRWNQAVDGSFRPVIEALSRRNL